MASLTRIGRRFEIPFTIVEGGTGMIRGHISEADQGQIPSFQFIPARQMLRTAMRTALKLGMVVRSPAGVHYVVGENGPSEQVEGPLWQSWRLFECTGRYQWKRRTKTIDPVTELERDGGYEDMGMIWAALEPLDREVSDFRMSASFEQARIITGRPIASDDLVDNRKVVRADVTLGVRVGVLT
jgi:hypothetical protein